MSDRVPTDMRSPRERAGAQCELEGAEEEAGDCASAGHWEECPASTKREQPGGDDLCEQSAAYSREGAPLFLFSNPLWLIAARRNTIL